MQSTSDFKILNPPKPPVWRDPRRLVKPKPRNFFVGLLSLFCIAVAVIPTRSGYLEPISMQITRGEPQAWLLFALIGFAVLSALSTLLRARRIFSSLFCILVVAGLWTLATTDPTSTRHLYFFVYLAAAMLAWVWGLWASLQDGRLFVCGCGALLGALTCILSFGIGERLMILSALGALNTLLLTDLLE